MIRDALKRSSARIWLGATIPSTTTLLALMLPLPTCGAAPLALAFSSSFRPAMICVPIPAPMRAQGQAALGRRFDGTDTHTRLQLDLAHIASCTRMEQRYA